MSAKPKHSKMRSKGDQAFRFAMILFWIGFAATAILVALWTWHSGADSMRRWIDTAEPWFAAWRLFLFVVLIGGWRHWSFWLTLWAGLDDRRYQFMLSQRWRVAAWLLVIEAVLVQGVVGRFILTLLQGSNP